MSAYDTELRILKERLITDPTKRDVVERRIRDVEAAIAAEGAVPAETITAPETATAEGDIENAAMPKAQRRAR